MNGCAFVKLCPAARQKSLSGGLELRGADALVKCRRTERAYPSKHSQHVIRIHVHDHRYTAGAEAFAGHAFDAVKEFMEEAGLLALHEYLPAILPLKLRYRRFHGAQDLDLSAALGPLLENSLDPLSHRLDCFLGA